MPNIKQGSALSNYDESIEIKDYEKTKATIKLLKGLDRGEKVGKEQGWLTIEELEKSLGVSK